MRLVRITAELCPPRHLCFPQDEEDRHHDRGEQHGRHENEEGWCEHEREVRATGADRLLGEELPEH